MVANEDRTQSVCRVLTFAFSNEPHRGYFQIYALRESRFLRMEHTHRSQNALLMCISLHYISGALDVIAQQPSGYMAIVADPHL